MVDVTTSPDEPRPCYIHGAASLEAQLAEKCGCPRLTDPRPTVAATLRAAAEWFPGDVDSDVEMWDQEPVKTLRAVADAVVHASPDDACCPVCEEVTCDEGCPLEGWRIY